jgi:hypothetical protein
MTDSYNRWGIEQVAGDVKEAICRVSDSAFDPGENANIPTVTYEVWMGGQRQQQDCQACTNIVFRLGCNAVTVHQPKTGLILCAVAWLCSFQMARRSRLDQTALRCQRFCSPR